ncbi:MAG: T9SS type A sorting domain-containing protein [bacterium]|nr:T9SS type A sorting domain-containing protein [bacterium]
MFRSIILSVMLLCLCGAVAITLAQPPPPDTLWTGLYGGPGNQVGNEVQQTSDGGFIAVGNESQIGDVYLLKTDSSGNQQWIYTLNSSYPEQGKDVQVTTDGGYIILACGTGGIHVTKTDASGNTQWSHYVGSGISAGRIKQTTDGGYIIGGTTLLGYGVLDMYLLKLDPSGNFQWHRTFGGENQDEGHCVDLTTDGGYIVVGESHPIVDDRVIFLVKTDSLGNQQWFHTYSVFASPEAFYVQTTFDGGFIITGKYSSGQYHSYLLKSDSSGNLQWWRDYGEGFGQCVQQTSDSGYVFTGQNHFGELSITKNDESGNSDWVLIYPNFIQGNCIRQTTDNGYIIVGDSDFDIALVRLSPQITPPTMEVTLTPINPPIVIPANGGWFYYNINVHNYGTQTQNFNAWNLLRKPNGMFTPPVWGPITRTLPANANPTRMLMQTIAGSAPAGNYLYISYVGIYPWVISDSSFFPFTKSALSDGGDWVEESSCTGDFFEKYASQDNPPVIPNSSFVIRNCSPNPFNPTTTIRFDLSQAAQVTLEVFDVNGRVVGVQHVEPLQAGSHEIQFDGSGLPSGVYIYRLTAGATSASGKMVLLK